MPGNKPVNYSTALLQIQLTSIFQFTSIYRFIINTDKFTSMFRLVVDFTNNKEKKKENERNNTRNRNQTSDGRVIRTTERHHLLFLNAINRSIHLQMLFKIDALKNFAISTGKYLCWSHFSIKLQPCWPASIFGCFF